MEVEEHIVEEFLRRRGYLTETNIRLEGNREIDILAYSPSENNRYHIEVSVRLGYPFQYKNKLHGFDVTSYPEKKFEDERVKKAVTRIFATEDYQKVIVIWKKPSRGWDEIQNYSKKVGIGIWFMEDIISELLRDLKRDKRNQRDIVVRTLQLVSRAIEIPKKG